jgi:hypothetical protein
LKAQPSVVVVVVVVDVLSSKKGINIPVPLLHPHITSTRTPL